MLVRVGVLVLAVCLLGCLAVWKYGYFDGLGLVWFWGGSGWLTQPSGQPPLPRQTEEKETGIFCQEYLSDSVDALSVVRRKSQDWVALQTLC